jgi:hypothetical protein
VNGLDLMRHGLRYGAVLSVLLSIVIVGSLYHNAEMWAHDYPPDIRAKFGPVSDKAKRQQRLVAIPFFLSILGTLIASIIQLKQAGELTLFAVSFSTFIILQVFNLVDWLILDWLVFVTLRPRFVILPGTEGLKGYGNYGFHFRGFLIGLTVGAIASLAVAGITKLIYATVG